MYITCIISIANLKLIDNLIVSSDKVSSAYLTTESTSFWIEAAIDCLRVIGAECRHTNFNSYINV